MKISLRYILALMMVLTLGVGAPAAAKPAEDYPITAVRMADKLNCLPKTMVQQDPKKYIFYCYTRHHRLKHYIIAPGFTLDLFMLADWKPCPPKRMVWFIYARNSWGVLSRQPGKLYDNKAEAKASRKKVPGSLFYICDNDK